MQQWSSRRRSCSASSVKPRWPASSTVQRLLGACGVSCKVNPRLVRGLDYYSHTVFEFITDELGAQGTLCGGGRYDGLFEILGGKPTPAVGWGMGAGARAGPHPATGRRDRRARRRTPTRSSPMPAALPLVLASLQALRGAGVSVQMHAGSAEGMGSMKSQFKRADASGARYALVFGADELAQGAVTVKALRDGAGAQVQRPLAHPAAWPARSPDGQARAGASYNRRLQAGQQHHGKTPRSRRTRTA